MNNTMNISAIKTKEQARDYAIAWQTLFSTKRISYQELYRVGVFFELLAKKFNLKREFKENGII